MQDMLWRAGKSLMGDPRSRVGQRAAKCEVARAYSCEVSPTSKTGSGSLLRAVKDAVDSGVVGQLPCAGQRCALNSWRAHRSRID